MFDPHEQARTGAASSIHEAALAGTISPGDAWQWLMAARDVVVQEIDELLGDVEETTALRFDDDGAQKALAHLRLALVYLKGSHGYDVDVDLASAHLERAFEHHTLASLTASTGVDLADAGAELADEPRAVWARFTSGAAPTALRRVLEHLRRLERLHELGAPEVFREGERRAVRQLVPMVCPLPAPSDLAADELDAEVALATAGLVALKARLDTLELERARRSAPSP